MFDVGTMVVLDIVDVGADGEFVAYLDGHTFDVRGAIIGERVRAVITGIRPASFRALVIEVLSPSHERIDHPWPLGAVENTGAADYGHMTLACQRATKRRMIIGQAERFGGAELARTIAGSLTDVESLEDDRDSSLDGQPDTHGWHYRTRISVMKLERGCGLKIRRTQAEVQLSNLPLASERLQELNITGSHWDRLIAPGASVRLVGPSASEPLVLAEHRIFNAHGESTSGRIHEVLEYADMEFVYELDSSGFWQIHERAPQALVTTVMDGLGIEPGDDVVDLYSGSGLFSVVAAELVGPTGQLNAYEGFEPAVQSAAQNLAHQPWANARVASIDADVMAALVDDADIVIADPPRAGLGEAGARALARSHARRIALVSCETTSMARDVAAMVRAGRRVIGAHALDIFPNTHFVETVCIVE